MTQPFPSFAPARAPIAAPDPVASSLASRACARPRFSTRRPLWPAYRRVPAFAPVPVRARHDGWSAARQGAFIGWLAQTGSVAQAAARVGLSRESAYRLRRRADAGAFAAAWDAVLAARSGTILPARKVTPDDLRASAYDGPVIVRMYRGRFAATYRQPSDSALLRLLSHYDRALRQHDREGGAWLRQGVTHARYASVLCQPRRLRWR